MKLVLITLILFSLSQLSCKNSCVKVNQEAQLLMKDLYLKKINFPDQMEKLKDETVSFKQYNDSIDPSKYTIVHFFTADCDKCVNELSKIQKALTSYSKDLDVNFFFIASAPTKIFVKEAINKIHFQYPIYYEKKYFGFKSMNNLPLEDDLYNTMLINNENKVVLFGAFYSNEKAQRLFKSIIECSKK
jgi:hypothetical protein